MNFMAFCLLFLCDDVETMQKKAYAFIVSFCNEHRPSNNQPVIQLPVTHHLIQATLLIGNVQSPTITEHFKRKLDHLQFEWTVNDSTRSLMQIFITVGVDYEIHFQ